MKLFESSTLGDLTLKNRMVLAPLTRNRASAEHIPTSIMKVYYEQRAGAGLLITEGTSPSPNGTGYARIPGIYNQDQIEGWKPVTTAVHAKGAKIFMQLMHMGRVGHPNNMPEGAEIIGPSAIGVTGEMYTDQEGFQPNPVPREMTTEDLATTREEFVQAAKNAIEAGFDGVELHSANGYLLEQFMFPGSNQRTDEYGGSIANRIRFVLEVVQATIQAIGAHRVGIRLSPGGAFNDVVDYPEVPDTFDLLSRELEKLGVVYIHTVDHGGMGWPALPFEVRDCIRANYRGTLIVSGGYDGVRAEKDLQASVGDLVAFGRSFLANPDLPERIRLGAELNTDDPDTWYTPGPEGYIDYPELVTA
ncbi:MAG TPA: alkene reductase [Cytophagales bacterium]|nr:alkene reductase [Cytophagales bacterium]